MSGKRDSYSEMKTLTSHLYFNRIISSNMKARIFGSQRDSAEKEKRERRETCREVVFTFLQILNKHNSYTIGVCL